jgi:hypothetical protein
MSPTPLDHRSVLWGAGAAVALQGNLKGAYMTEAEAKAKGNHADHHKPCP